MAHYKDKTPRPAGPHTTTTDGFATLPKIGKSKSVDPGDNL